MVGFQTLSGGLIILRPSKCLLLLTESVDVISSHFYPPFPEIRLSFFYRGSP